MIFMKNASEYYEELKIVAEAITIYYDNLAFLEYQDQIASPNYQTTFQSLYDEANHENILLTEAETLGLLPSIKQLIDKDLINKKEQGIILKHSKAHIFRLQSMIESMSPNDVLKYVYALKYDISRIILAMIEELFPDAYYEDIKEDLISFKYSLIFSHIDIENEFLAQELDNSKIRIISHSYRNPSNPGYRYIDKGVLVSESNPYLMYLENVQDFLGSNIRRSLVIISILNILARLVLCDENTVSEIYEDLMNLLKSEQFSSELQDEIKNMLNILEKIQSRLTVTRI